MRAVVQKVKRASVSIDGKVVSEIEKGLMVLLGVTHSDTEADADYIAQKVVNLRIFEDEKGKLNRSVMDENGKILLVSQFTLYGDARKGRRPSFILAAPGEISEPLYELTAQKMREQGIEVKTGVFGADMAVELINDGPTTILLESDRTF